jgi:hypothetical protein
VAARRAFYVTQGSLTVWWNRPDAATSCHRFADSDEGFREFNAYLSSEPDQASVVLVDVIEEEFSTDSLPRLGLRDRKALLQRRIERKYPRTHYRLPVFLGRDARSDEHSSVVYSAITNHELLDPWLRIAERHRTPVIGIYSVPLLAPSVFGRSHRSRKPMLLLTQQQGTRLRQVFVLDGHVRSARLSQSPPVEAPSYGQFLVTEVERSRRYLERSRLLGHDEQLDVCIVAGEDEKHRFTRLVDASGATKFSLVSASRLVKRNGLLADLPRDRQELLYLAAALTSKPKHNYAVSGENRHWVMRRMRHALTWSMLAVATASSVAAGIYVSDALMIRSKTTEIEAQVAQLAETYRRENENADPIRADSDEMKAAVDTGNHILVNRLPVPWVMQQLGLVLGEHPAVQVLQLSWAAEAAIDPNMDTRGRRDNSMPVAIPPVSEVQAELRGELIDFDGNMREAFKEIDRLVRNLEEHTAFSDVVAIEYPLDARPQGSISGEIVTKGQVPAAQFRLRLRYPVASRDTAEEVRDDSV